MNEFNWNEKKIAQIHQHNLKIQSIENIRKETISSLNVFLTEKEIMEISSIYYDEIEKVKQELLRIIRG